MYELKEVSGYWWRFRTLMNSDTVEIVQVFSLSLGLLFANSQLVVNGYT